MDFDWGEISICLRDCQLFKWGSRNYLITEVQKHRRNGFLNIYESGEKSTQLIDCNLTKNNLSNYKIIQGIVGDEKKYTEQIL